MILDPFYDLSALLVQHSWLRDAEFCGAIDIALVVQWFAVGMNGLALKRRGVVEELNPLGDRIGHLAVGRVSACRLLEYLRTKAAGKMNPICP